MKVLKNNKPAEPKIKQINNRIDLEKKIIEKTKFSVSTSDGIFIYAFKDVLFCSSNSNYTEIHFHNGKKILICRTLKSIQESFPENLFCRTHQSYLVNKQKVVSIRKDHLLMEDGTTILISKSKYKTCIAEILNQTTTI